MIIALNFALSTSLDSRSIGTNRVSAGAVSTSGLSHTR